MKFEQAILEVVRLYNDINHDGEDCNWYIRVSYERDNTCIVLSFYDGKWSVDADDGTATLNERILNSHDWEVAYS
jgi:hypothetical protein